MEHKILKFGIPARFGVFKRLLDKFGPVADGGGHVAGVDEVEGFLEGPGLFCVVDFEFDVVGHPWRMLAGRIFMLYSGLGYLGKETVAYHVGCVGLKSVPIIVASGNSSAMSIDQMPVPVPMSRILSGFSIGAKKSLFDIAILIIWWVRSRRSSSF